MSEPVAPNPSAAPKAPALTSDQLRALHEVNRALPGVNDWAQLVERMMDLVLETLHAERGVLFLLGADGVARPEVVRGADEAVLATAFETSQRILEQSLLQGEAMLSSDARSDLRFTSESVIAYNIVSFMCVPLRRGGRLLGTLYVDHRRLTDAFTAADLAFLGALADLCAAAIENSQLHQELQREVRALRHEVAGKYRFENLIGASEGMVRLFSTMERVADSDATVLIQGENGTGKELVARALHQRGRRSERPFVTIDCGTLTPELAASELFGHRRGAFTGAAQDQAGLFERAEGGTVFLDQIEDLPLALQSHLLRVVQEGEVRRVGETSYRKVHWRLIAATRLDLAERVRSGAFREDLYYRLRVVPLDVPPLRERKADIPTLAEHFLTQAKSRAGRAPGGFSREAMATLLSHTWPGNVRELQHAVERAALLATGARIEPFDLAIETGAPLFAPRRGAHPEDVEQVLRAHAGNVTLAAATLGITRRGLQKRLRRLGIDRTGARNDATD